MNQESAEKNIFESMANSFDQIHKSIEQLTPGYTQSLSNLQQEYLTTWKNMVCSNITLQREYSKKMGLSTESMDIATQIIQKMTEEVIKGFKAQSNFIQSWLNTSQQNIHAINKNSTTFSEVNKKFITTLTNTWNGKK